MFPATIQNGGELEEATMHARGRELHLPEQRDGAVPPPDLLQGADFQNGVVANPRIRFVRLVQDPLRNVVVLGCAGGYIRI